MGMFDSFYGGDGSEWQTKAFGRSLARWDIGDEVPGPPIDYQAEVIGGRSRGGRSSWSYATIRGGRLVSVGDARDWGLPVRLYSSGWRKPAEEGEGLGHY